jgi:superfamily II DNA or RNA helicase
MVTIHARESFLIKKKELPITVRKKLEDKFRFYFFDEKACKKCEFLEDRLTSETKMSDACGTCAAFGGGAELATDVKIGTTTYLKTPIGNPGSLLATLDHAGIDYRFKHYHPDKAMRRPMRFTGTLKDHQPPAVKAILEKKRGVLRSPPRSGKTVMATAAICKIGKKTIIMASQREWLLGFRETFVGSKTQEPLTSCRESQIGFAKKYEDFLKYDVCLVTVQTFYSEKGQRLLRKIRDMFSVLVIDEVHTGAAPKYAVAIAGLNCEYMVGLSGTPSRKDGRYIIMRNLIGPLLADIQVKRLRPHIRLTKTAYHQNFKQAPWPRMISSLEKNPQRLKLIAEWALKDAKAGHMILIPFAQVTPIKALVKAINIMAGRTVAYPFFGGLKKAERDKYIQAARTYKIKILVGNIKLLSTGTNIPRASALYEVTMSSNKENAEQRFSRILTPWDDKPTPIVRFFLDDMNVRKNCLRNEWFQVMKPKFKPVIQPKDEEALRGYFSNRGRDMSRLEF